MTTSDKKIMNSLLITLSILLVGIGVFYGTYYFFISKSISSYEKVVKAEITKINKVNENISVFTKGQTIDEEKILEELPSYISSLEASEKKLKNLAISNKYSNDHENLILGIKENISMYNQIYIICKNPKNSTLDKALTSLQNFKNQCMNYYSLISIKDAKINLPKECIDFLNNSVYFTERQIRLNISTQIANSQNKDFFNSMTKLVDTFNSINNNFSPKIVDAGYTEEEYDNLINYLDNCQKTITGIKSDLSTLTIPNDGTDLYKYFIALLNDYSRYIQDFKYAVKTEKLTYMSNFQSDSLDKLYENANEKLNLVNNDYAIFIKEYNSFKENLSI